MFFFIGAANAADSGSRAGHGHMSLSFQSISVDGFESAIGEIPIGKIDTRTLVVDVEYNLTDRITIIAGIPYVRKRYRGPFQHNPLLLDPPRPSIPNVDQGDWNSDFQDFHLGFRYRAKDGPIVIEPYVFLGVPSNEYPFFANAAVGTHQGRLDVGSGFTWFPGLSNAYYRADVAYVFVEQILGVNVNHWRISGEIGYQINSRWTGRVFTQLKKGKGLVFPNDFPTPRTDELWYQHDRLVKHNYMNSGIGVDWTINSDYHLSVNVMTQVWAEQVHIMKYAWTFSIARAF